MTWHGYAADRMNEFIAMAQDGTRDLANQALKPFYDNAPYVSVDEVNERKDASDEYRLEGDLSPLGEDAFSFQIAQGTSRDVFTEFVEEMGIERSYSDDMWTEEIDPILLVLRDLSDVITALEAEGIEPDTEAVQERFEDLGIPFESVEVLHLSEPLPDAFGEEDSIIAEKLRRARVYVETYFSEESP